MPRPTKQTVDYFPHYVGDSKTKFMLENRWGNEGYAFWFKMLELLCKTDGHAYCLKDPLDWEYFVSVMNVDDKTAKEILDKLSGIGKIDTELWENHKTIWCQHLMDHIKFVYDKRTVEMPQKPSFRDENRVSAPKTTENSVNDDVSGVDNPQSKVNKSKVNRSTPSLSPPGENTPHPPSEEKKKPYGSEFGLVKLTDDEYGKLAERLGKSSAADYIDRLDGWLAEGHRKKNHYATVLNWWRKDHPELADKGSGGNGKSGFKPSRTG